MSIIKHSTITYAIVAIVMSGYMVATHAAQVQVQVTVENLAPQNSISFAPLRIGFHNGTFDAFNNGQVANPAIVSVAEGGSGSAWFPAFAAADPSAVLGTVFPNPPGPLLPGNTGTATFMVDTAVNPYFTFAAMAVPSNDFFIGNDSPAGIKLFDGSGNLLLNSITQKASDIWDAGSETFDPAAAAFVGNNSLRTPQNSVVSFNFSELAGFDGLLTGGGYIFDSQLTSGADVYRISFSSSPVPEGQTFAAPIAFLSLGSIMFLRRKTNG